MNAFLEGLDNDWHLTYVGVKGHLGIGHCGSSVV